MGKGIRFTDEFKQDAVGDDLERSIRALETFLNDQQIARINFLCRAKRFRS